MLREQIERMYNAYCNVRKLSKEQGELQTWGKEPMIEFAEQVKLNSHSVSYQTVDIAVLDRRLGSPVKVLMGKRKHENAYRFIGGFVDVQDSSLEEAAMRELKEECGLNVLNCKYTGSFRIDDPRFRDSADKIMTAFFCCDYISGEPVANDDIHEVRWFELNGDIPIVKEHQALLFWLRRFQKRFDNLLTYITDFKNEQ